MIETYFNNLMQEVERKMGIESSRMEGEQVIRTCQEMVSFLRERSRELKDYVLNHPFSNVEEEICFFKYYKPALTGRLLVLLPGIPDRERLFMLPGDCPDALPQGYERIPAETGTIPSLLPVLPERGDLPGPLLFPPCQKGAEPGKRKFYAGGGFGDVNRL